MASSDISQIRVLHVDDEPNFADLAANLLERADDRLVVATATSAEAGLDRLRADEFDCIVSDYDMPGQNGIEFLDAVRANDPGLPFILFTGKGSEEIASEAISAGVTDYLQKEGGTDQYTILANRIQNAVEQQRTRRERQRSERNFEAIFQDPHMLVGVLAPDGTLQQANQTAMEFVDAELDEVTGQPFWTTPWWAEEDRIDVEQWIERAANGEYVDFEATHTTPDGECRFVRGTIRPVRANTGDVAWIIASARDITEQKKREQRQREEERYRQELYQITSDFELTDDEKIQRSLQLGCERLGVENGHLVVIDQEADRHEVVMASGSDLVEAGDVTELSRTYCRKTIAADDIVAVHHAEEQGWGDDLAFEAWDISCYLGGKILVEEELYGTLCFANRSPREEPFGPGEKQFVDLMSRWISQILERRQHTEDLRVKKRAMDAAPVGIVITDPAEEDNPIIYANEGFERLTGYPESEIVGRNCRFLQGPETRAEPVAEMRAAIDAEEPVSVELLNYRSDGTVFWDQVSIAPVRNDEDELTHFVGFQHDVTRQRQQQETLEHREQVLREMYEIMADRDRPFAEQTKRLLELGRSELDTAYGTLSEIRGAEYRFEIVDADDASIQSGDVVPVSETNCEIAASTERTLVLGDVARDAPDETHRAGYTDWGIACYIGAPVYAGDDVYGTFCFYGTEPREGQFSEWEETLVDLMSRWVSYELERVQRETELQDHNARLEEFASIVSHDLRNPLNVLQGSLELAEETGETEHFDRCRNAVKRMERLIDDLLTLARQDKVVAETEPVDVAELINTCWHNVATGDATLNIETDLIIQADQSRLQQLLENLLGNAIEHGGEGVTVTVGETESGFYVEDDGTGIAEGKREEVFESGYSTSDEGSGFGLSIIRQIADAHGWEISVAEGREGGARFEITDVELTAE